MAPPIFPNNLWDGKSLERANILIHRPPGPEDWNQIVAEVMALEQYALYLKNLINDFSGGAPGGISGQIQFNNNGSFAGFNGNVATSDLNGLTDAVAIGSGSFALGEQSLAIGYQCIASTNQSVALGYQCIAGDIPQLCAISGTTVTISGDQTSWFYPSNGALVLSNLSGDTGSTIVYGDINSVNFDGTNTVLTLSSIITSHTSGYANMKNNSTYSFSCGYNTSAHGYISFAEGYYTIASGTASHAEGSFTTASGQYSHAEGSNTNASGQYSHAEGSNTNASGKFSHVEGQSNIASTNSSHAEGEFTVASGRSSHAGGSGTTASGFCSYADGYGTIASGVCSYAGGNIANSSLFCQWSRSDGNIPGQISILIVSGRTTNTSPINLLISGSDHLIIPINCVVGFLAYISAYKVDGSSVAFFIRQGIIKNVSGTVSLVGSISTVGVDNNVPGWTVAITADSVNSALNITVTGEATVNWRTRIDFTEVGV